RWFARRIFPSKHAMCEWRERQVADSMPRARRKNGGLRFAPQHGVLRLARSEGNQRMCPGELRCAVDLLRGPLAEADGAHLSRAHRAIQCQHGLLKPSFLVVTMALVNVDRIHVEPFQRAMQLF